MKIEKAHHVLQALHTDRIDTLTKEALVTAFNDDGIFDLEGTAEYILKRMKKDKAVQKTELKLTDFTSFSELTSEKARRSIIHRAPEVSFILDGIEYDPKDISNFDGQALIFAPIIEPDGSMRLQVFHEEIRSVLAGYFQMQQIITLINPTNYDFPIPGLPPPVTMRDPIPP